MTEEQAVDTLCNFLRDGVCADIQLKRCNDDRVDKDAEESDWVHPAVYPIYMPMVDRGVPGEDAAQQAPSLTVTPKESDTSDGNTTMGVRIIVATWDPGERRDALQLRADAAWRAMSHLSQRVRRGLLQHPHIGGLRILPTIKFGMYAQREGWADTYPYCLGWVDCTAVYAEETEYSGDIAALID